VPCCGSSSMSWQPCLVSLICSPGISRISGRSGCPEASSTSAVIRFSMSSHSRPRTTTPGIVRRRPGASGQLVVARRHRAAKASAVATGNRRAQLVGWAGKAAAGLFRRAVRPQAAGEPV
jgi:hypothetical protein